MRPSKYKKFVLDELNNILYCGISIIIFSYYENCNALKLIDEYNFIINITKPINKMYIRNDYIYGTNYNIRNCYNENDIKEMARYLDNYKNDLTHVFIEGKINFQDINNQNNYIYWLYNSYTHGLHIYKNNIYFINYFNILKKYDMENKQFKKIYDFTTKKCKNIYINDNIFYVIQDNNMKLYSLNNFKLLKLIKLKKFNIKQNMNFYVDKKYIYINNGEKVLIFNKTNCTLSQTIKLEDDNDNSAFIIINNMLYLQSKQTLLTYDLSNIL